MQDGVDWAANQALIPIDLSGLQMNNRLKMGFDIFLPEHLLEELLT
jgi:hypothetical protein